MKYFCKGKAARTCERKMFNQSINPSIIRRSTESTESNLTNAIYPLNKQQNKIDSKSTNEQQKRNPFYQCETNQTTQSTTQKLSGWGERLPDVRADHFIPVQWIFLPFNSHLFFGECYLVPRRWYQCQCWNENRIRPLGGSQVSWRKEKKRFGTTELLSRIAKPV